MALFTFSTKWETDKTGEELCETFVKDNKIHKKENRKKNKYKTDQNNTTILYSDQKSLIKNTTITKKSPIFSTHDNKKSRAILKSKDILKKMKKKIFDREVDNNIENSKLFRSNKLDRVENYKNKKGLKRKRALSETVDENKPLLKKNKRVKTIKSSDDVGESKNAKINKKQVRIGAKNNTTSLESNALVSSEVKKMLKSAETEQIFPSTKHVKNIKKKLKKKKKNLHKTMDGDSTSEKSSVENIIDPVQLKKRKEQLEKLRNLIAKKQEKNSSLLTTKHKPVLTLRQKMMHKLKAARFRFLNEQIYTTTSKETEKIFRRDPDAFMAYHEGYRQQVKKWPLNPLDRIIKSINKMPKSHVIADFGCGEAKLASSVEQKVYSFDLVAANDTVIACDMAHVPMSDSSIDVAVFCLSLMGTNLNDYLIEANRVLKNGGLLKIAEVESRFEDIKTFTKDCEQFGFKKSWMDLSHNLFYFIDFRKESSIKGKKKLPFVSLQPCLYKKR